MAATNLWRISSPSSAARITLSAHCPFIKQYKQHQYRQDQHFGALLSFVTAGLGCNHLTYACLSFVSSLCCCCFYTAVIPDEQQMLIGATNAGNAIALCRFRNLGDYSFR
ncbi:unnamed protein product [Ceratitis capitata]|uniref:(Mediterranean fruit fly) hypothetical protein n=1 Tax=Ceratitis capitata TaxID=7213 RepID=A0A811UQG1_CERCA|nr:unnamed protein product [Ceratitis capitata]